MGRVALAAGDVTKFERFSLAAAAKPLTHPHVPLVGWRAQVKGAKEPSVFCPERTTPGPLCLVSVLIRTLKISLGWDR